MQGSQGFNYFEIMVALLVISIVATVSLWNAAPAADAWQLHASAQRIALDSRMARARAISQGVDHRILFDTVNDRYCVQRFDGATWEPVEVCRELPAEINLTVGGTVQFRSSGGTLGGTTVVLVFGSQQRIVQISAAGRPTIQ